MAPESSRVVVLPKFDMHIYTSELTSSKLKEAIDEYCILLDLHPRLPPLDIKPTVSLFRVFYKLCKQGHWFSFENKTGRNTKKCFKEVTSSLRGWKKKFFLIDRRAISDARPWRHGDTDLHDDFPATYSENNAARLSEFLVPLRPPPRHLLYVCGLTTACRHPDLQYNIKDRDNNVISMDAFLKLPTWTGTVVSKGNPIPDEQRPKPRVTPPLTVGVLVPELTPFQKNLEKPNPKIAAAREKKDQQNFAKAEAKRVGAEATGGPKKKRMVQKHTEPTQSSLEEALSATPIHQVIPEAAPKPAAVVSQAFPRVEKEVVDLSGNTRVSTPPVTNAQRSPNHEHHETYGVHSPGLSHQGDGDEPVRNRYVPNWGLHEFLGALSNVEVVSRAYQTLGQSVVAQGELLKRHEQLNHDYVELRNRNDAHLLELDCLRSSVRRLEQDNEGLVNKLALHESAHSGCESREKELMDGLKDLERERDEWGTTASNQVKQIRNLEKDLEPKARQLGVAEEKIRVLEGEKLALSANLAQAEADRQRIVREFILVVVKRLTISPNVEVFFDLPNVDDVTFELCLLWSCLGLFLFVMALFIHAL
ncbi:hypothetical protein Tco_0802419 [Tanacetum coccineum]|uniref:Transposase (Putative), gypsy type n=1 Tax=Tanacetum coccineum TaxID=301880 RepID=A0ABQ5A1N6_9ASTR